jgi:hypothetical protein
MFSSEITVDVVVLANTSPQYGHLIFLSVDAPAHPKEKNPKNTNTKTIDKMMFTDFDIVRRL